MNRWRRRNERWQTRINLHSKGRDAAARLKNKRVMAGVVGPPLVFDYYYYCYYYYYYYYYCYYYYYTVVHILYVAKLYTRYTTPSTTHHTPRQHYNSTTRCSYNALHCFIYFLSFRVCPCFVLGLHTAASLYIYIFILYIFNVLCRCFRPFDEVRIVKIYTSIFFANRYDR